MSLEKIVKSRLENNMERWILTTAQYNSGVNHKFLDGLDAYANANGYKIGVLPVAGAPYEKDEILHKRLQEYTIFDDTIKINDSLEVSDWKVKPQQIRPLTGIRRFTKKNKSTIFGSTKQHIEHIATNEDYPKLIATTGAVTVPHYNLNTRQGRIALEDHEYGALAIDVLDDKTFLWRNILANKNGKFYDIKGRWDGKKLFKKVKADALVMGDSHYTKMNGSVYKLTLDMIKKYKPRVLVDHDIFEGGEISHHNIHNSTGKYFASNITLDKELSVMSSLMNIQFDALPKGSTYVVPQANHNEHLNKWVAEGRYLDDPVNMKLGLQAHMYVIDGRNPLEALLKEQYGLNKKIKFLHRNDDFKVRGMELARHGDLGANGSRGSVNGMLNMSGRVIKAHTHTADKHGDVYTTGTRTLKRIGYNKGDSSWTHTNTLLFPNGKAQLISIVDGVYNI